MKNTTSHKKKAWAGMLIVLFVLLHCIGCSQPDAIQDKTTESDANCASCHELEAVSKDDPGTLYSAHLTSTCTTCHTDENGSFSEVHENSSSGKTVKKLRHTEVLSSTCLSACHTQEAIVATTADSTVLTDTKKTSINPHDIPAVDDHSEITCSSCHKMHAEKDASEQAKKLCGSCHHANVYECYTCHN